MRIRKNAPNAAEINAGLTRLAAETERIYLEYKSQGEFLSVSRFRDLLNQFWHGTEPKTLETLDLVAYTGRYIQERLDSGKKYNLLKGFRTLQRYFAGYRDKIRAKSLPLDSVDLDFHAGFVAYLTIDKGLAPNTIHKAVNRLKTIMSEAFDRKYTTNSAWRSNRFTAPREQTDAIYLTEQEIGRIAALDLSARPAYERTRDSFLFGCYTGLRYSDFSSVAPENISVMDGITILKKRQVKTRRFVAIPLFAPALEIVEKYGGAPPVVNNQVMNRHLKEIARIAGISGSAPKTRTRGQFSAVSNVQRWALVTTHTARRYSFVANDLRAVREGRDWRGVMDITGHRTESQFFEYVKVSADVLAVGFAKQRAG